MKEKISTIPLIDAFKSDDECPFCYLERMAEQHAISFVLGSGATYMEGEVRAQTDEAGFCRIHYHKMYDYGNRLGSAMILQTHLQKVSKELEKEMANIREIEKVKGFFGRKAKFGNTAVTSLGAWLDERKRSCYVCNHIETLYERYLQTFFDLYKKDKEFQGLFADSKGFCLPHFRDLTEGAYVYLNEKQRVDFCEKLFDLMKTNMKRVEEDVAWFVEKQDYLNRDADWKNARDSVQRGMQKAGGGYPADPIFKND